MLLVQTWCCFQNFLFIHVTQHDIQPNVFEYEVSFICKNIYECNLMGICFLRWLISVNFICTFIMINRDVRFRGGVRLSLYRGFATS